MGAASLRRMDPREEAHVHVKALFLAQPGVPGLFHPSVPGFDLPV